MKTAIADELERATDISELFSKEELNELENVLREAGERLVNGTLYERTVRWYSVNRLYRLFSLINK